MDDDGFKGEVERRDEGLFKSFIEIVATPPGDAPLHIRSAWVGLVLPTPDAAPQTFLSHGVASRPRGLLSKLWWLLSGRFQRRPGYRVPSAVAIALLESHAPDEALWWRTNTPHFLAPTGMFLFQAEACRRISANSAGSAEGP